MKTNTNYIQTQTVNILTNLGYKVLSIDNDYRKTSHANSKLRVRLGSKPKDVILLLEQFKRLHGSLILVKVTEDLVVLYFQKKHSKLKKPKQNRQLYGLDETKLRPVRVEDRVQISKFSTTSLGEFFKVLRVGLENIFLQSESKQSRIILPLNSLLSTNLKFV